MNVTEQIIFYLCSLTKIHIGNIHICSVADCRFVDVNIKYMDYLCPRASINVTSNFHMFYLFPALMELLLFPHCLSIPFQDNCIETSETDLFN